MVLHRNIEVINCHNTNGYGECWDADPIYKELISKFNDQGIWIQQVLSIRGAQYDVGRILR